MTWAKCSSVDGQLLTKSSSSNVLHQSSSNSFQHTQFLTLLCSNRSSRQDVFCWKGVLRNFAKFTGKHLYQSLFFLIKLRALRTPSLLSTSGLLLLVLFRFLMGKHVYWISIVNHAFKPDLLSKPTIKI